MAEKVPTINLLPHNSESFMTQFFNWALSIGRLLIILTEIVALGTFIYRFSLDMETVDLQDKISSESFIVENFKSAEDTFRDIQSRIATVQHYAPIGNRTITIFNEITKIGQGKVTFKDLLVDTQSAQIEVQAPSASNLSTFVDQLKTNPDITSISVDKVENDASSAFITVVITATLKPAAFAQTEQQTSDSLNQTILNSNQ